MKKYRAGFFKRGNCYKLKFAKTIYATCIYYTFWRFYLCIDTDYDAIMAAVKSKKHN